MKKIIAMMLTAVMAFALAGCGDSVDTEGPAFEEVNTIEGVSLELAEDTLKASRGTFTLTNDTDKDLTYDPKEFHLETKEDDGWQESVGTRLSEWKTEEMELIKSGESIDIEVNWKAIHGTIAKGDYRVTLMVEGEPVSCEFYKD